MLSDEALQETNSEDAVAPVSTRFVGTLGACESAGGDEGGGGEDAGGGEEGGGEEGGGEEGGGEDAGGGGGQGAVLATTEAPRERFPAASYAITVNVYEVPHVRLSARYVVDLVLSTCVPFTKTMYPATPTLSRDALQLSFADVAEAETTLSLLIADGARKSLDAREALEAFRMCVP